MSKKRQTDDHAYVYSTDPGFSFESEKESIETAAPAQQPLRIRLDTKQRAGKAVTLVTGFSGKTGDLEELGKKLKGFCGTGGSVKDGQILVQGDHREKVLQWLVRNGYTLSKKA